jgi:heat shock protein HslJ
MRALVAVVLLTSACTPVAQEPLAPASGDTTAAPQQAVAGAADDGTYLQRIDPLGGQWRVQRIGDADFARHNAWVGFSDGGFLNHGAGCGGSHAAFYRLAGSSISLIRRESVRIGKCAGTPELANGSQAMRAAATDSETQLGAFLDQVTSWSRNGHTLMLTARDGTRATLTRPREPNPELAGRWFIETIGGERLATERRQATLSFGMGNIGAHADCNSMGSSFTVPAPGRIDVAGPIVGTAIGCAPEDHAEDELMTRAMTGATGYHFRGERLVVTGDPGMTLRRPPAPDRRLAGEYELCGNTLLGAYHEGPVTVAFDERTVRDNAQCVATYRAEGPDLDLELAESRACSASAPPYTPGEPVAIGGNISVLAVARPDGFAFTEQGQLILRTERGLLTMCRKGEPKPFGSG